MEARKTTYSRKCSSCSHKYKVGIQELAMADLMAMGWADRDAFIVTGLYQPLQSDDANMQRMYSLTTDSKPFLAYLAEARRKIGTPAPKADAARTADEGEIRERLSKDYQLRELLYALDRTSPGTKEWLDIKKMIADITQAKKEESTAADDDTVHYFLPLSCRDCSLYIRAVGEDVE